MRKPIPKPIAITVSRSDPITLDFVELVHRAKSAGVCFACSCEPPYRDPHKKLVLESILITVEGFQNARNVAMMFGVGGRSDPKSFGSRDSFGMYRVYIEACANHLLNLLFLYTRIVTTDALTFNDITVAAEGRFPCPAT